jgi:hypothetical protein
MMGLCFWYPSYVDNKWGVDYEGKAVDSRMGFVIILAFPFIACAWGIAGWQYLRLIRAWKPFRSFRARTAWLAGTLLLLVSLGPLVGPFGTAILRLLK